MLVAAEHQMDVDVCHFSRDPLRLGGQLIHSARHASKGVTPSHEWVEGLLDYYHQTGNETALRVAVGIGENILRLLELPKFNELGAFSPRENGWALRALCALYLQTHEPKWAACAQRIVGQYESWMDSYGAWVGFYTDHVMVRVPFMISVAACSLMRYYTGIRQEARVRDMIVRAAEDLIQNCLMDNGMFYYKELPSLRRVDGTPLTLETLSYAYEFTGDRKFLQAGLPTFQWIIRKSYGTLNHPKHKIAVGDAVICDYGTGPKRFAISFYSMFTYYRTAAAAGLLDGIPFIA
jgi:hypothetical protein